MNPAIGRAITWIWIVLTFIILNVIVGYVVSPRNYDPSNVISLGKLIVFLPLDAVLFIFLYFSIVQYSKAKKLRIEQQNKLAMIQFYIAHETKGNKEHMSILLPKFADILIREAMPDKGTADKNLPIDEIVKIVELAVKK